MAFPEGHVNLQEAVRELDKRVTDDKAFLLEYCDAISARIDKLENPPPPPSQPEVPESQPEEPHEAL